MDIQLNYNHSKMSDKLLKIFNEIESNHWWWLGRRKITGVFLDKINLQKECKILDGGCGTGAELIFLQQYGEVYGVDLSPIAIKFCKERGLSKVKVADLSKLPFQDNFFDLVCLMDVIEHIKDSQIILKEIKRVLKPGGHVFLTVPALPFIFSLHDTQQGHFRRYRKSSLREFFDKAGFKEKRLSYFNFLLSPPIIFIRLLSRISVIGNKIANFDSRVNNNLNYSISKISPVNKFLYHCFAAESVLMKFTNLPLGVSIIALYENEK